MMNERCRRREFVRAIALGASSPAVLAAAEPEDAKRDGKDRDLAGPANELDARMALVLARFRDRLDDADRARVRTEVAEIVHRAEQLRHFALTNGDGPLPVFTPYRGDD